MPKSVTFVIPAHGRLRVSVAAFAGIAWTCAELGARGVAASAVVVADDENLDLAAEHGFETIESSNGIAAREAHARLGEKTPPHANGVRLGGKFNDGFQAALARGADFVIPCGSDDWVHPDTVERWIAAHAETSAPASTVVGADGFSIVRPDGRELAELRLRPERFGIRLFPAAVLESVGGRPAPEEQSRSVDSSILRGVGGPAIVAAPGSPLEIVDFKSDPATQLNGYDICRSSFPATLREPWSALAEIWPDELIDRARGIYEMAAAA